MLSFEEMSIKYKKYSDNAHVPKRAYPGSAGYNLWAAESKVLKPWSRELIRLDLFITFQKGYYGRLVSPSDLANTHGITVHNETIDSDYRGIVCVVLSNLFNEEYVVKTGNRIGQLITEPSYTPKFVEVNEFIKEKTGRGQGGFGSSGV